MQKTVKTSGYSETTEKKSKFIGLAVYAEGEERVNDILSALRREHRGARHIVYAYRLLSGAEKYSDDGEPYGTAGQPLLELLRREGYTAAALFAVRYFGGVLLGRGGLTRAYVCCAKAALDSSEDGFLCEAVNFAAVCDYESYERLTVLLNESGAKINDSSFTEAVTVNAYIEKEKYESFADAALSAFARKINIEKISEGTRVI